MKNHVTYSSVWQFGSLSNHYPDSWHYVKNQPKSNLKHVAQNNKLSAVYSADNFRMAKSNQLMNNINTRGWSEY